MNQTLIQSAAAAGTFTIGGDLTVNRIGYGAMRITGPGIWGPPADKEAALATLRRAIMLGVTLIDTADSYGPGNSEQLLAEALYPYPADLVIATKGGWERPGPNQWTHNASPKHLTEALEGSLKRLRLDRIDIYQLHAPDNVISFEASVEALARLRDDGKIRHVGLSNVTREHVERARKIVPIVSVQNRYVLLTMKDGKKISGKLLSVDTFAIQIFDSNEKLASISKDTVRDMTMTSPMPSYRDKLTTQELSDVISYLMSLKGQ